MTPRARAASRIVEILDSPFLRALTEPARLEVLRVLLVEGPGDIGEIAQHLPQDRSVVSRHLRTLEAAGIVSSRRDGRHILFQLDGEGMVKQLERILTEARSLAPLCCPPSSPVTAPDTTSPPRKEDAAAGTAREVNATDASSRKTGRPKQPNRWADKA